MKKGMTEPTEEQIKEFWEWCGLTIYEDDTTFTLWQDSRGKLVCCGHTDRMLDIDLNNLFKYAVPKLKEHYRKLTESYLPEHYFHSIVPLMERWIDEVAEDKDPAFALLSLIWEVIKNDKQV